MGAKKKRESKTALRPNRLVAIDDGCGRVFVFRAADQKSVLKELKETNCTDQEQLEDYDVTLSHPTNKYICIEYKAKTHVS